MKKNKRNDVKEIKFPNELGVEKLNALSLMLNDIGLPNISATNKKIKGYGILLKCSYCGDVYCLKSYNYQQLMSINIKEEIYDLMAIKEVIFD